MPKRKALIQVKSPASIANLGAGYDCLAIAVDLWNYYQMDFCLDDVSAGERTYCIGSMNNDFRDVDPRMRTRTGNYFIEAFDTAVDFFLERTGNEPKTHTITATQANHIPPVRGLGSSSSATVAGVLAAVEYFTIVYTGCAEDLRSMVPTGVSFQELLATLAREVDSCPDNICAALAGGLTMVFVSDEKTHGLRYSHFFRREVSDSNLRVVVLVPDHPLQTVIARGMLSGWYAIDDVVFNLTRAVCMSDVLASRNYSLLREVTKDKIHQTQRSALYGNERKKIDLPAIFEAALREGAFGAFISGAGSSLAALTDNAHAEKVARAFESEFKARAEGTGWWVEKMLILEPTNRHAECRVFVREQDGRDEALLEF